MRRTFFLVTPSDGAKLTSRSAAVSMPSLSSFIVTIFLMDHNSSHCKWFEYRPAKMCKSLSLTALLIYYYPISFLLYTTIGMIARTFRFRYQILPAFKSCSAATCILSSRNPPESLMSGRFFTWGRWKKAEQDNCHEEQSMSPMRIIP